MENLIYDGILSFIKNRVDGKLLSSDENTWNIIASQCEYLPLSYKANFVRYQNTYFDAVYDDYTDISTVIYSGGIAIGIWPLCIFKKEGKYFLGSLGTEVLPPKLSGSRKSETQRRVYEKCIQLLKDISEYLNINAIDFCDTIMSNGVDLWCKKLMEHGCTLNKVTHQLFANLSMSDDELQKTWRRTNKYSVAKGNDDYDIKICDENCVDIPQVFKEFHRMHALVSGRETRSQKTWDILEFGVVHGNDTVGHSFVVMITDKTTNELAGAALFNTTHTTGIYSVAVYDRTRFSRPVGHIVQAVAINKMRSYGIKWYEIGERPYITDNNANEKTVNIGLYKEGFATNTFLKIYLTMNVLNSD